MGFAPGSDLGPGRESALYKKPEVLSPPKPLKTWAIKPILLWQRLMQGASGKPFSPTEPKPLHPTGCLCPGVPQAAPAEWTVAVASRGADGLLPVQGAVVPRESQAWWSPEVPWDL